MEKCKPVGLLNSFLSYAPQLPGASPVSLHHSLPPQSPWGGGSTWGFGSPRSRSQARNRGWLWHFLFIDTKGGIFISQNKISNSIKKKIKITYNHAKNSYLFFGVCLSRFVLPTAIYILASKWGITLYFVTWFKKKKCSVWGKHLFSSWKESCQSKLISLVNVIYLSLRKYIPSVLNKANPLSHLCAFNWHN